MRARAGRRKREASHTSVRSKRRRSRQLHRQLHRLQRDQIERQALLGRFRASSTPESAKAVSRKTPIIWRSRDKAGATPAQKAPRNGKTYYARFPSHPAKGGGRQWSVQRQVMAAFAMIEKCYTSNTTATTSTCSRRGLSCSAISRFSRLRRARRVGDGPSVPCGDIARCNKGCNPPYHHGLGQQWRVTLIRYDDDFELTTACQDRIHSSRGQHI